MFLLCSPFGGRTVLFISHFIPLMPSQVGRVGDRVSELRQQRGKLSPRGREDSPREPSLGTRWAPLPFGILPTEFT